MYIYIGILHHCRRSRDDVSGLLLQFRNDSRYPADEIIWNLER